MLNSSVSSRRCYCIVFRIAIKSTNIISSSLNGCTCDITIIGRSFIIVTCYSSNIIVSCNRTINYCRIILCLATIVSIMNCISAAYNSTDIITERSHVCSDYHNIGCHSIIVSKGTTNKCGVCRWAFYDTIHNC